MNPFTERMRGLVYTRLKAFILDRLFDLSYAANERNEMNKLYSYHFTQSNSRVTLR